MSRSFASDEGALPMDMGPDAFASRCLNGLMTHAASFGHANLEKLFLKAAEVGELPAIITMDGNETPERCLPVARALATGQWFDVAIVWYGRKGEAPPATFMRGGRRGKRRWGRTELGLTGSS